MKPETLEIKTALQILKPVQDVFKAIVEPELMSKYFISKSSGKIEAGKSLDWEFPEFDGKFPVRIDQVEAYKYISYYWEGYEGFETLVEIKLEPRKENSTLVTITEKSLPNNESGITWLGRNTEGWANFLACLKAYVEYNIELRKGAFDFMTEF